MPVIVSFLITFPDNAAVQSNTFLYAMSFCNDRFFPSFILYIKKIALLKYSDARLVANERYLHISITPKSK